MSVCSLFLIAAYVSKANNLKHFFVIILYIFCFVTCFALLVFYYVKALSYGFSSASTRHSSNKFGSLHSLTRKNRDF